jgi:hypothetical protein
MDASSDCLALMNIRLMIHERDSSTRQVHLNSFSVTFFLWLSVITGIGDKYSAPYGFNLRPLDTN